MARSYIYKSVMITLCLYAFEGFSIAQERINVTTGIGIQELLNVGLRYHISQTQLGISIGSLPLKEEKIFSISADAYFHFGGRSELSTRRPWYSRIGMNYLRDETKTLIDKYLYANVRVGRDFNFSEKLGMNIELGMSIEAMNDRTFKDSALVWIFNLDFPILPGLGICLFYRI